MTQSPQRPIPRRPTQNNTPKPYKFVSFPHKPLSLEHPAGHHKFDKNCLHGTLFLTLQVQTSLHVSTGIVALGDDVQSDVPLIKTMTQGADEYLTIQGSSLKGCIRSVYEAITNSTLAITTSRYKNNIPTERKPCKNKDKLCPASRVFGALNWQGLIEFNDAKCQKVGFNTGFMPSLYRPRPDAPRNPYFNTSGNVVGRKFYYHTIRAIEKGRNQGIAVQQAACEYSFTTQLHFKNLKPEELGTLFVVLGQDSKYPIALKVGGGKPIGMGSMTVEITQADILQNHQDIRARYSEYTPSTNNLLTEEKLKNFITAKIQAAHSQLIQKPQLEQLTAILRYPTDREPPEGMY